MARQIVDRGLPLEGIQTSVRDQRIPYSYPRALKNVSLRDKRIRRRSGMEEFSVEKVFGQQLTKHTSNSLHGVEDRPTAAAHYNFFRSPLSYGLLRWSEYNQLRKNKNTLIQFILTLGDLEELVLNPYIRTSRSIYGADRIEIRGSEGVYVYDQTVLANHVTISPYVDDSIELITNGTFDTDTDWTKGTGWSISGGQATHTGTAGYLSQNILTPGKIYKITFDIVSAPNPATDFIQPYYNNSPAIGLFSSVGTHSVTATALSGGLGCALRGSGNVVVDNISVREVAGIYNITPNGTGTHNDVVPLTSLAVAYNRQKITLKYDLWNSTDSVYVLGKKLEYTLPQYRKGDAYHISILQIGSTLTFYVDDIECGSYTLAADEHFVGEYDATNGQTVALKRDVVLLNECTARGTYSSTCVPQKNVSTLASDHGYATFYSYNQTTDTRVEPWACSPPAGTGITELRYFNTDDLDSALKVIDELTHQRYIAKNGVATPIAYFPLDSGFGYCRDEINDNSAVSIHHSYAPIIDDTGLLHSKGLHFADGQHVITSFSKDAGTNLISPAHSVLSRMFAPAVAGTSSGLLSSGEFTFEVQIRTPNTFGQNISTHNGAISLTGVKSDSREGLEYAKSFGLTDGRYDYGTSYIRDENGTAVTTNQMRWHRAFDQTIFSVEGISIFTDAGHSSQDNWYSGDARKVPLVRGLLTPEGKVAFELYSYNSTNHTRELRVVSSTALDVSTVYTLGFRRRMIYVYDPAATAKRVCGFALEIFINGTLSESLVVDDGVISIPGSHISITGLTSYLTPCAGVGDIIIGASYVNHGIDASMTTPNADSATAVYWPTSQRFMAHRQDQVGFFTLGYFRLWHRSLSNADLVTYANSKINSNTTGLVFNLEVENAVGDEFYDKGSYSVRWSSNYKGWGYPQIDTSYVGVGGITTGLQTGWLLEDSLGYDKVGTPYNTQYRFKNNGRNLECTGLAFYSPTLSSTFGILAAFKGFTRFDKNADGDFVSVQSPGYGLLSNYSTTGRWQGVNIGDRTVLTSPSGFPKIFNGTHVLPLGFREYRGGRLLLTSDNAGTLTSAKYYGVRVFYFAEKNNIYHISDQYVIHLHSHKAIYVNNIPQHPDPRVTSIMIGVTTAQETYDLAANAPVYAQPDFRPNRMIEQVSITSENVTTILPTSYTKPPHGTTAASYNSRLFIAGDPNIPDIVYFSDAGNPEAWDTLTNRIVLEEGSGDRIVALRAMFGALYAFKANSIWRIDEVAVGQFQLTRIAAIGPASELSLETITIPDSGRTAIIFWSAHGPYLFDEVNLQYLGFPVEQEDKGFDYVKHDTVFTVHDLANRSVLFYYQTPDAGNRYNAALVFNYRHNVWTTDTGRPGYVGLSVDITKRSFGSSIDSELYKLDYLGLVGSDNGTIYKLSNDTVFDGYSYDDQHEFSVTSWNESENVLSIDWGILDPPETDTLNGLWITVLTTDKRSWVQLPILRNDENYLYVDTSNADLTFSLDSSETVQFGLAPVYAEFPWDMLDVPYYDKQIHRATFWASNKFLYAMKHSWRDYDNLTWKDVNATGGRIHIERPARTGESFKMFIQTTEKSFRFDGVVYVVEPTTDANFK